MLAKVFVISVGGHLEEDAALVGGDENVATQLIRVHLSFRTKWC